MTWSARPAALATRRRSLGRSIVGGFYLTMGGVHLGLVAADPRVYDGFADSALFGFVRDGWQEIVMAHPDVYGLLLTVGEVLLGTALLIGGRAAVLGWAGVIAFHVLLLLFGWWAWVWAVPALAVLLFLARRDLGAERRPVTVDPERDDGHVHDPQSRRDRAPARR